jgi:hypothetical protein
MDILKAIFNAVAQLFCPHKSGWALIATGPVFKVEQCLDCKKVQAVRHEPPLV